jgi:uncharacterized protein (TIGR02246 family)
VATGIIAADNDRDITRVMRAYAPDAVLLPPGEGSVQGAAAIRRRYESLFAEFSPAIQGRIDEICVSGAIAIVRGHNGGRLSPLGGTPPRELSDSYLMALARGADGTWRITHLIWHRDR